MARFLLLPLAGAAPWRELLLPSFEADHNGSDRGYQAPGAASFLLASQALQSFQEESGITERLLSSLPQLPKKTDLMLPMSDGVEIFTRLVLPYPYDAKRPTCLVRSPYGSMFTQNLGLVFLLLNGHAVVMQEVRGTWRSQGVYDMLRHDGRDARDTMAWVAAQAWSDGDVFTMGASADGLSSLSDVLAKPKQLHGQWIIWAAGNGHNFLYPGGAFRQDLAVAYFETLKQPTRGAATGIVLPEIEEEEAFGPWWYDFTACGDRLRPWEPPGCRYNDVKWPMVYSAGWWDIFHDTIFEMWFALQAVGDPVYVKDHVLVVGPLGHNIAGKLASGLLESARLRAAEVQALWTSTKLASEFWFWRHCSEAKGALCKCEGRARFGGKGSWSEAREVRGAVACAAENFRNAPKQVSSPECQCQEADGPTRRRLGRVNFFVMGSFGVEIYRGPGNYWCSLQDFPRPRPRRLYLAKAGLAAAPPEEDGEAKYTYDPSDPAPNEGGDNLPHITIRKGGQYGGSADQREREKRSDVLVFDSEALAADLPVVGNLKLEVYLSSSAPDTDFFFTVDDLSPGGKAMLVRYGMQRMRWREDWRKKAAPLEPGKVYKLAFDLGYMAYIFSKGNRVRLSVSSAAAPYYNPTSNTGANDMVMKVKAVVAENGVHFGPGREAFLELPEVSLEDIPENKDFAEGPASAPEDIVV